jgi:NADH-quinone oxidoreductase subunit G
MIKLEINGQQIQAKEGQMLIDVADDAAIPIPRFCYHKKLSVAANCRMCLVEVANSPKCVPACATAVADGMVVKTQSPKAVSAQQAVMEFLLINHPLDCPICDQGGECELQDVAMDFGSDVSFYSEPKRILGDRSMGPLIQTDLTRCIHCTRCVRFGQEIAGAMEIGMTGRGEHMEIATFLEKSVDSELSGNVIDLCPVGALTSKPFRYKARTWELKSYPSISLHDAVGTHTFIHAKDQKIMRVVPRENEALNEVWISDRDRFSYTGLYDESRLASPMIRQDGRWVETDWETALIKAAELLGKTAGSQVLGLGSANSATEELFLFTKLIKGLGGTVETRLRQADLTVEPDHLPVFETPFNQIDRLNAFLLVGSNVRKEIPLVGHRLRQANHNGAFSYHINPMDYDHAMPMTGRWVGSSGQMIDGLKSLCAAVAEAKALLIEELADLVITDEAQEWASALIKSKRKAIFVGHLAQQSTAYSALLYWSQTLARLLGAQLNVLPQFANTIGASAVGAVCPAKSLTELVSGDYQAAVLLNTEIELDALNGAQWVQKLEKMDAVVALTSFVTPHMKQYADVLLPLANLGEFSGSMMNLNAQVLDFQAAVQPFGESKPVWKVLRVLGNMLHVQGFDYVSLKEVQADLPTSQEINKVEWKLAQVVVQEDAAWPAFGLYASDALSRRSQPLQSTSEGRHCATGVVPGTTAVLGKTGEVTHV